MTNNRAAVAPITGYTYQFDLSILQILLAGADGEVTVEGIEDVDIFSPDESVAVQCKYYSSREFSLASIRTAILPMLDAFAGGREWTYRLHVYFKSGPVVPSRLSLEQLKRSLTEDKRLPAPLRIEHFAKYSDTQLQAFLDNFEIVAGLEFDAQRELVIRELERALKCSLEDARDLYHANALSAVMALSILSRQTDRRITRQAFLSLIDKKMLMFTRWHKEIIGEAKVVKDIRRRVKGGNLLAPIRWRFLLVDDDKSWHTHGYVRLQDIALRLATEDYGAGKLTSAKPWTIAVEGDGSELVDLKRFLLESQIPFSDGGEMIAFQPGLFDRPPFTKTYGRSPKVESNSYNIRVVGIESLAKYVAHGGTVDTLVSVAKSDPTAYRATTTIHLPGFNPVEFAEITELKS